MADGLSCARAALAARLAFAITVALSPGCYQSHGLDAGEPADAPAADSSTGMCTFSFRDAEAGDVECRIAPASRSACLDAARCVCEARLPDGPDEEVASCVDGMTLPRALVTLGDFCAFGEPARMDLAEALSEFIPWIGAELRSSEGCADVPALLGPRERGSR